MPSLNPQVVPLAEQGGDGLDDLAAVTARGRTVGSTTTNSLASCRSRFRIVGVPAVLGVALGAGSASASPDFLVPAMKYGATDCSFCHLTPQGGEAHNERGLWLVAERDRRGAETVDVAWLAARDTLVAKSDPVPQARAKVANLPAIKALAKDRNRPLDYTTAHGDWPAYGGGLRAQKYSPLDQISADTASDLAIAWVWEAFDNHRFVGKSDRRKTPDGFKATPLVVGGRLFVRTAFSAVAALDPITGATRWTYDPDTGDGQGRRCSGFRHEAWPTTGTTTATASCW